MDHRQLDITDTQRANLIQLADYVESGKSPVEFDMTHWLYTMNGKGVRYDLWEYEKAFEGKHCKTTACLAGHGPLAGIEVIDTDEGWSDYNMRCFGVAPREIYQQWLFDEDWVDTDNSLTGAVARVRYALEYGIPDNHLEQRCGQTSLCYMTKWMKFKRSLGLLK